jgi:hypothetical protein
LDALSSKIEELIKERNEMNSRLAEMDKKLELIITNSSDTINKSTIHPKNELNKLTKVILPVPIEPHQQQSTRPLLVEIKSDTESVIKRLTTYPNSDVVRIQLVDEKRSWSRDLVDYAPVQFTARHVLSSLNADHNLLYMLIKFLKFEKFISLKIHINKFLF